MQDSHFIRDAVLTEKGKSQCSKLKNEFPYHDTISIVMSSPLRRAIQTASLSFGPTIRRQGVEYLLVPLGQEVSGKQCDIGHSRAELEKQIPALFEGQEIGFDASKIDFSLVEDGWNSKVTPPRIITREGASQLYLEDFAKIDVQNADGKICSGSRNDHKTRC